MKNIDIVKIVKDAKPKKIYNINDLEEKIKQQAIIDNLSVLDLESKSTVIKTIKFIKKLAFSLSLIVDEDKTEEELKTRHNMLNNWLNIVDDAIKGNIMDMDELNLLKKRITILKYNTVTSLMNIKIEEVNSRQKTR